MFCARPHLEGCCVNTAPAQREGPQCVAHGRFWGCLWSGPRPRAQCAGSPGAGAPASTSPLPSHHSCTAPLGKCWEGAWTGSLPQCSLTLEEEAWPPGCAGPAGAERRPWHSAGPPSPFPLLIRQMGLGSGQPFRSQALAKVRLLGGCGPEPSDAALWGCV